MVILVSEIVVLVFGVAIVAIAGWGIVVPDKLMRFAQSNMDRPWGIHVAVIVRLVLGAALIGAAPASRFPLVFQVLGIVALAAAVALAVAGRERLRRFVVSWVERFSALTNRLWLLLGVAFGAFIVYGVL